MRLSFDGSKEAMLFECSIVGISFRDLKYVVFEDKESHPLPIFMAVFG